MYFPSTNPLSVVSEDQGVWAPVDHQRIIAKLTMGLGVLFHREKVIRLEPLPETMLDEGKASLVPDILLRDNETAQTPIIIEVCHTNGLQGDLHKVVQLIDGGFYGILEGFIYDYRTHQWLRYRKGNGGLTENSSFTEILQLDLNSFL
jgi:Uma2 family endonuclease